MGRTAEEPLMNRHEAFAFGKSLSSEPKSKDTARSRNLWAKLDAPDFALMAPPAGISISREWLCRVTIKRCLW
jgi:hypothetical protein